MFFWLGFGLLDSLNYYSGYLQSFHDLDLLLLTFLMVFVSSFLFWLISSSLLKMSHKESPIIEMSWSCLPAFLMFSVSNPSMELLYLLDFSLESTCLSLKVNGLQWYWKYDFSNFNNLEMESFMLSENDLKMGSYRLLEVDNKIVLPIESVIRVLVTSSDVLHSWALPMMGVKLDANPGRINQSFLSSEYPGVFYGQCSELCGANHSFMPIVVEFTSYFLFMCVMQKLSSM